MADNNLGAGEILFQDCQFLVYKAIHIKLTKVPEIRMANCFISAMTDHLGYDFYPVIDSETKVLLRVWNVTLYANNTFHTSGNEDFDYYVGNSIVVRESVFAAGTPVSHSKLFQIRLLIFKIL